MSMWHTILQDASFKGVPFEVVNIDESNGKAIAEHSCAFEDGVELEEMGLSGQQIQLSVVFYGKQYTTRLKRLLKALESKGAGVLVHPVFGRMNKMLAVSWQLRHDAENVDYCTLDITFRQSGKPQEIFLFENHFLMSLEKIAQDLKRYQQVLLGLIDVIQMGQNSVMAVLGNGLGVWASAKGLLKAVAQAFDLPLSYHVFGDADDADGNKKRWQNWQKNMSQIMYSGLATTAYQGRIDDDGFTQNRTVSVLQGVTEAKRQNARVLLMIKEALQQQEFKEVAFSQKAKLSFNNEWLTVCRLQQLAVGIQLLADVLEKEAEHMSADELMAVHRQMRLHIQAEVKNVHESFKNKERLYDTNAALLESLRAMAGGLNSLILAAINQKPPLIVRAAPIDGTIQQQAFAFYADHKRAEELRRLNPQFRHTSFISQGSLINAYAK